MSTKLNVHEGHRERLRNKFIDNKEQLESHEILELLLGYSIARKDTNELAHRLIDEFGSLENVLNADTELLKGIDGVGETTACLLSLIGYVSKKDFSSTVSKKKFSSIKDTREILTDLFKNYDHEVFYAVFLNKKNLVKGTLKIDTGLKDTVEIDFNELSRGILINKPSAVIIAHNHFSPIPEPSEEDDKTTEKIYSILKLYKVNLFDHIIISGNNYYSYFYENRLQKIKDKLN